MQDLIPMLTSIISDSFATSHPPLVLATLKATQTMMTACWPRVGQQPWQNEILKALVLCWLHFTDDDFAPKPIVDGQMVQKELVKAARTWGAIAHSAEPDAVGKITDSVIEPLIAKQPSLRILFGIS
jgi:hypothetical protein